MPTNATSVNWLRNQLERMPAPVAWVIANTIIILLIAAVSLLAEVINMWR